ncbi:MAG: ribosome assembly cofactor RimP [Bacteroidetes bacterium]|nr:MAG: ribosome assembly cofactor RimP [Bacteroidota bacterium]TDI81005.1 MAG: ribosome assembly cofactor RimP [Bacteroidota bacterium]
MQARVKRLLQNVLDEHPTLFLIDLSIGENNQIKVIIDGDEGVKVEDCIAVSRGIEHNLDREEEDFSLEVLSAGVSEPLTLFRQYKKNIGRRLSIRTETETIEGNLTAVNEAAVTLQWKTREPKPIGKGKITVQKEAIVPYKNIVEAKVMITFN